MSLSAQLPVIGLRFTVGYQFTVLGFSPLTDNCEHIAKRKLLIANSFSGDLR